MDFDPRDRDEDVREIEMPWIELGRGTDRDPDDTRERNYDRERDARDRSTDPRDVFLNDLELPRGPDRELVTDGNHPYELNGDDSRTLATVGVFRVVAERDLCDPRGDSN